MGKFYRVDGKVEQDLRSLGEWLRDQGFNVGTIRSYQSRFREFAYWFKESHGEIVASDQVTKDVILEYREHLEMTKDSSWKVVTRLVPVRAYNRWAVETGRLEKAQLISKSAKLVRVAAQEEVFIYGLEEFLVWLGDRGLGDVMIGGHRSMLRGFVRWLKAENGVGLTPEYATPENLDMYWKAVNSSDKTKPRGRAAVHWYSRWALAKGYLDEDPFWDKRKRADTK